MTATTSLGCEAFIREFSSGRIGSSAGAKAIARCVESILSGSIDRGVCELASVTAIGDGIIARPSARRIAAAMGLSGALDAAIAVVDGITPGAPHAWVTRGRSGYECKACGAVVARHHGEPSCPHDAVADELERMQ